MEISSDESRDSSRNLLQSSIEKSCWFSLNMKPHLDRISKRMEERISIDRVFNGFLPIFGM
jgi:hypothetical protein